MKATITTVISTAVLVFAQPLRADIIYSADFESPPHTLDSPVATGGGNDQPSGTIGSVIARSGVADFSSQVASLEPAGLMGFYYEPTSASGLVLLSWDMAMLSFGSGGLMNSAQLSIDPSNGAGGAPIIISWQQDFDIVLSGTTVGSFTLGQQDHYELLLDLDSDTYDFALNGIPVQTNQALAATFNVQNVVFGSENLQDPSYAVDNFRWEVVPEPSTWLLISTGCLAAVYGRRIAGSK